MPAAPANFNSIDRVFDGLKQTRMYREAEWQQIADVFMPRKDFSLPRRNNELRRRRLSSSIPALALRRGAALLTAYMVDSSRPFIKPNVARGLVNAGRNTRLDGPSTDYMSDLEWAVFDRMMLPQSGFLTSLAKTGLELFAFGTAVQWTGPKKGFGPRYMNRPLRACWIGENDENEVDTLFYEFCLPLWEAVARWPNHGIARWRDDVTDEKKARQPVTIVHAVYPRIDGQDGAVAEQKPFAEVYFCQEHKSILAESGYDTFPYAVPRLDVTEGSPYGTGLAWHVLPEALVLHSLVVGVEKAVELALDPPLLYPQRMFGKPLDRRAGASNAYDSAGLGFQTADKAIQRLDIAGNAAVGEAYVERLSNNVEQGFYSDWMKSRETGNPETAAAVNERIELRIRALSAFVPGVDRDLMGPTADRTLVVMGAMGQLTRPPPQLSGVNVDWDFAGPLAVAQLKRQAEATVTLFDTALKGRALNETDAMVVNVEEGLRDVAEGLGTSPDLLRSREGMEELRKQVQEQQDEQRKAAMAQAGATALRDGAQGVASLAGAGQGAQVSESGPPTLMAA